MVTKISFPTRAHPLRTLWRGCMGGVAIPCGLAVLLLLSSERPWFFALLAAAAAATGNMRTGGRCGAFALVLGAAWGSGAVITSVSTVREVLVVAAGAVVAGIFPWTLGAMRRARREAREASTALEAQREQTLKRAAEARRASERTLLAEELHDNLGHALSLVALNLGRLELDPSIHEGTREAIALARTQVSETVIQLGDSVEALRGDEPPALLSRHRRADLDQLLATSRAAGATVEVSAQPSAERLEMFGSQTVFRIIQEGITNAVKHAPGQPVTVHFTDTGDRLEVALTNPGSLRDADGAGGPGSGLIALRERVHLAGGQMHAGDRTDVFTLSASLPVAGDVGPPSSVPAPVGHTFSAEAVGRLRGRAWVLLLAPLAVLLMIAATITVLDVAEARRTLLDADVFSQIRPAQSRAEVAPLLPADQLNTEADSTSSEECRHFSITSNPLDDASGDYYRICFNDRKVTIAERVEQGSP